MSNKLDDFFTEEYDKQQAQQGNSSSDNSTMHSALTYSANPAPKSSKKITVVLLCLALVLAIAFGVFVGVLIGAGGDEEDILSSVLDTLRNDYYFDISDEEWTTIIANGGTALLQGVDDYGQLLSPQDAYDLLYGTVSVSSTSGLSFGFSYYFPSTTGMLMVATVYSDTNAFGRLQTDDLVLALKDITGYYGADVVDSSGNTISTLELSSVDYTYASQVLLDIYSATFVVLRAGEVVEVTFSRGTIGSVNNSQGLEFIEYYFGSNNTNVSTTIEQGRATSTMQYKCLDQLPSNVGYIYISQFGDSTTSDCVTEFQLAMDKFKQSGLDYLIVDVKGNPGGNVEYVSDIAGMLATDSMLSDSLLSQYSFSNDANMLTVTLKGKDDSSVQNLYEESTYANYFDTTSSQIQITIWTDGNSASASELLTGVLLDYGTAVQMGSTTYGKGIAQTIVPLYNHSDTVTAYDGTETTFYWCLYYTSSKYYSPFGNNIHEIGYTPDSQYDGLDSYSDLVTAVQSYWS